jgi:transposase
VDDIARRFSKHPSTVAYWMAKHGLEAVNREKHAAKGGIERERLEALVEAGLSTRDIAAEVGLAQTSVCHWLRRFGLRTQQTRDDADRAAWRAAKAEGHVTVVMTCRRHGETDFVIEGRGYCRCTRCRSESVATHRRKVKMLLVDEAGGCCAICGYDRYLGALEFHHLDPAAKRLQISWNGVTQSLEAVRAEARKCVLLCSSCHAEVEGGATTLPRYAHARSP